jgi:hypothetical protein
MDTLHEERIYLVGFSFIRVIDHTLVLHGGRPLGLVGPSRGWKSSMKIQMGRCPARGLLSSAFLLPLGLLESSARSLGRDVPSPGPSSTQAHGARAGASGRASASASPRPWFPYQY